MRTATIGVAALLCSALPVRAAPADAASLRACMQANVPPAIRVNRFEMTTLADGASETLGGTLYIHRDDVRRALTLQIEQPSHLAGSAFLLIEREQGEQMYVYLSAMKRVRQINGAAMDGAFFGSALRYSDLRQAFGLTGSATMELLPDTGYDGAPAHALRLHGVPEQTGAADDATLLVDPERCVPLQLRVERDGELLREFSGRRADLAEDEGRWYLRRGRMHDRVRGLQTEIALDELRGFDDIPALVFSRSEFHRARFGRK